MKKLYALSLIILCFSGFSFAQEGALIEIANNLRNDPSNKLLKKLEPAMEDLQSIFRSTQDVGDAWMHVTDEYMGLPENAIHPEEAQTEVIVISVFGSDLNSGQANDFSADYAKMKGKLKDRVTMYGVKYVEPGSENGYSIDAFFKVNGHWVYIPNAWKAFDY